MKETRCESAPAGEHAPSCAARSCVTGAAWWRRLSVMTGRVILSGCIVAVALVALASLSTTAPRAEQSPAASTAPMPENWLSATGLDGGGWTIAGLPFQLLADHQPGDTTSEAVEARWLKAPSRLEPVLTGLKSKEFLNAAQLLKAKRRVERDYILYTLDLSGVRLALFAVAQEKDEVLVLGRALHKSDQGDWCVLEVSGTADGGKSVRTTDSEMLGLLPLPPRFKRFATRRDAKGIIVGDLSTVALDADQLHEHWRSLGYRTDVILDGKNKVRAIVCRREKQVFHAWLWPLGGGNGERTLVFQVANVGGHS